MFIRPLINKEQDKFVGMTLCRTNGPPLVDEDIEHFPKETSGKDIREYAREFRGAEARWGEPLYV